MKSNTCLVVDDGKEYQLVREEDLLGVIVK